MRETGMKKKLLLLPLAIALLCLSLLAAGCATSVDLTDYVSEYRSRIYIGTQDETTVFADYTVREVPYLADGNVGKTGTLFEIAVTVPDNTRTYTATYTVGGTEYRAELSFDSVRMVHTCSQSLPEPQESEIAFRITDDEDGVWEITAQSVAGEGMLDLPALLSAVSADQQERFAALTDGNTFAGEIYVRLLHEDEGNYYYVGLTDRSGQTFSILADAATGEVLATKEP